MNLSEQTIALQHFIQYYPQVSELDFLLIKEKYQEFIDVLIEHNHFYYVEARPIISDVEYDQLFSYLKQIEEYFPQLISSNSPTQSLIWQLAEGFQKADHRFPLLSLENSYDAQDLREREQRAKRIVEKNQKTDRIYRIEPKFDGISVEIIYQNWELVQGITRGDGRVWEDITINLKTIKNLPKKISFLEPLHLRGEIMMPKSALARINEQRQSQGQSAFSNTRNAAAGSIKLLDSGEVAKRGLVCFVYDILSPDSIIDLKELWFPIFSLPGKGNELQTIDEVIAYCQDPKIKQFLDEQDYDFDGLVIKITDPKEKEEKSDQFSSLFDTVDMWAKVSIRDILGATEHHPRRAIAYKFPAQQVASKILSVDFQVGRTGIITPVANLEPVQLSGAMISRVSLHNFDFIQTKQIKNGDFVRVQRSGEVIPYIVWVIKERRDGTEDFIIPPLLCPMCNSPVNNVDIHYYCSNPSCPAQIREKILHFVSRDAMDIWGIGEAIVEILVEQKILTSYADLYTLLSLQNQVLLRKFPNFWEKKIAELTMQLEASKTQPLWRILNGLGIPNIGKKTAQDFAQFFAEKWVEKLDDLLFAVQDIEALNALYGFGEKVVQGIQIFFANPEILKVLRALEAYGVSFSAQEVQKEKKNQISFSLTWTFPVARTQIIAQMQDLWYLYDEQPLQTTKIMFIWEKAGSKALKAQKLWLEIYEDWNQILAAFWLKFEQAIKNQSSSSIVQGGLF